MNILITRQLIGWRSWALLATVIFVTALFWARSRDAFERIPITLKTKGGDCVRVMAILPKEGGPFPVVVYLHGTGGNLMDDGSVLRSFAEQNLAAVGLEYCQTNDALFDAQFMALQDYLVSRTWSRSNATAWVGLSLGAQNALSFALKHPDRQPALLVRFSGGWVEELGRLNLEAIFESGRRTKFTRATIESTSYSRSLPERSSNTHVLIVQGEDDNIFPTAECQPLAESLRQKGMSVDIRTFAGQPHSFGLDRPLINRGLAEYCAAFFGSVHPLRVNCRPLHSLIWVWPGMVFLVLVLCHYRA